MYQWLMRLMWKIFSRYSLGTSRMLNVLPMPALLTRMVGSPSSALILLATSVTLAGFVMSHS